MKRFLQNIGWKSLELLMIILVTFAISIFCSMIALSLIECYKLNPNTLFVIIPCYVLLGWYFTIYLKHK